MSLKLPKEYKSKATPSHRHAPRQEERMAKDLGGQLTKGSGCRHEKGDVRVKGVMRLETKCTAKKSFSLTRDIVRKIELAASEAGEIPAIQLEFLTDTGDIESSLAVVPIWALEMIVGDLTRATE